MMLRMFVLAFCAILAAMAPVRAEHVRTEDPSALVAHFMQAWSVADAKGLASLFATDADLVTPDGTHARGQRDIEGFYAAAFARGYAGSIGSAEIVSERALSPDVEIVDARWSIMRAHNADGTARPAEKGILMAVLAHDESGWRIAALRENAGAVDLRGLQPQSQ